MIERTGDLADIGTRATIGVAGAGYTYFGLPMSDLVGVVTIVYLLVSTLANIPRAVENVQGWIKKWRTK